MVPSPYRSCASPLRSLAFSASRPRLSDFDEELQCFKVILASHFTQLTALSLPTLHVSRMNPPDDEVKRRLQYIEGRCDLVCVFAEQVTALTSASIHLMEHDLHFVNATKDHLTRLRSLGLNICIRTEIYCDNVRWLLPTFSNLTSLELRVPVLAIDLSLLRYSTALTELRVFPLDEARRAIQKEQSLEPWPCLPCLSHLAVDCLSVDALNAALATFPRLTCLRLGLVRISDATDFGDFRGFVVLAQQRGLQELHIQRLQCVASMLMSAQQLWRAFNFTNVRVCVTDMTA